jgi:hypothetical protein
MNTHTNVRHVLVDMASPELLVMNSLDSDTNIPPILKRRPKTATNHPLEEERSEVLRNVQLSVFADSRIYDWCGMCCLGYSIPLFVRVVISKVIQRR